MVGLSVATSRLSSSVPSRSSPARLLVLGMMLLSQFACSGDVDALGPVHLDSTAYEVVHGFPGEVLLEFSMAADGSLFVTSARSLFKSSTDDPSKWTRLAETPGMITGLQARSASRLYAITRYAPAIHEWSQARGWIQHRHEEREGSTYGPFLSLAAFPTGDVVAVGSKGAIIHLKDGNVTSEVSPVSDDLWSVTVVDSVAYAVTYDRVLERHAGGWSLFGDQPNRPAYCGLGVIVAGPGTILVAGGELPCLLRYTEKSRWQPIHVEALGRVGELVAGVCHAEDTFVLWSNFGSLLLHRGRRAKVYRLGTDTYIAGAFTLDGYVYAVINRGDQGQLVRFPYGMGR